MSILRRTGMKMLKSRRKDNTYRFLIEKVREVMRTTHMKLKVFPLTLVVFFFFVSASFADQYGVYVKVIENAKGTFDEVSDKVESALSKARWKVLASFDTGVPEKSVFQSRVIVFSSSEYEKNILSYGAKAAFALPLRVGVYEDSAGIHVVLLNPVSINRTILNGTPAEEKKVTEFSLKTLNSITSIITNSVPGDAVTIQLGEIRSKGKIGGKYGGDFADKIKDAYTSRNASDLNFRKIIEDVHYGIINNRKGWRLIYTLNFPSHGVVMYGITKERMEAKTFSIVRDMQSEKQHNNFPLLFYNTAFPMEVIVYRDEGTVKVVVLDEMYRMKLYFHEIEKWKLFFKYYTIPGQIQEEIEKIATDGIVRRTEQ
jgi:uncharacterized protein (DUF302 family)